MPTYDVHVYAVVRVPIKGVKAKSPKEAIKKVDGKLDLHKILDKGEIEYAEDVTEYLVDEVEPNGDVKRSFCFDKDGEQVDKNQSKGVRWVEVDDFAQELDELKFGLGSRFKDLVIRIVNEGVIEQKH